MSTVTFCDEKATGERSNAFTLELPDEQITVRELIRSRVYQEVKDYNLKKDEYFQGLVQPTDAEAALNGYKMKMTREIDWQKQFAKAIEAFEINGFLILVDDHQVTELEETITLRERSIVSFLKLTPLVGG